MNQFLKTRIYKASKLFVLIMLFLVGPLGAQVARAQEQGSTGSALVDGLGNLLANIAEFIFFISAWLTAKIGGILDWAVDEFILTMSDSVESIGAIDALWQVFRDLGNIVFIFLLLYAAISFILNTSQFNAKKILARVVIVALFVNFSLFATKIVIDTSNVLALQFYENIVVTEEAGQPPADGEGENARLSSVVAAQMNLSSTQSDSALEGIEEGVEANSDENPYYKLALARIMGAVFVLTAGFIMLAFAALIIIRFFVLIFLMIASPIAFIAWTLPSNSFGEKWWNHLLSQSFFAPAVMGMLYVTFKVGNSFKQSGLVESNDLIAAITAPEQNVSLLVFFAVMMGMLIASLVIAKQIGAVGANKAVAAGKSTSSWAGAKVKGGGGLALRGTVGAGSRVMNEKLKDTKIGHRLGASQLREATVGKGARATFGTGKSSYQAKSESKKRKGRLDSVRARERAREEVEQAETDAERRRALANLSSREKIDYGKEFLEEHAHLLSEGDIKAVESHDGFSEQDRREIKQAVTEPIRPLASKDPDSLTDEEAGKIKAFLGNQSDDQLRSIDIDIVNSPSVVQNMSTSQFDEVLKNKSKEEQDQLIEKRLQPLNDAIRQVESGESPEAVKEHLGEMKDEDIASLLKRADNEVRTSDAVVDEISTSILSKLAEKGLKSGEKDEIRRAVLDRATQPNRNTTDKNKKAAEWAETGPGKAIL